MKSESESASAPSENGGVVEAQPAPAVAPAEKKASDPIAQVEAARAKAAQLLGDRQFSAAKKALEEADTLEAAANRFTQAEAIRAKAAQLMSERKFGDARNALLEADAIEAGQPAQPPNAAKRLFSDLRSRVQNLKLRKSDEKAPEAADPDAGAGAVDKAIKVVGVYSKVAAIAGIVPGNLVNFAAIFAVNVIMVWRIAKSFGHYEGQDKVRSAVLSLLGSIVPVTVGHGTAMLLASIPAMIGATVVYFVATPVLAYAVTKAVGNTFIMHFESGGTLLTFDPKAFGEYFLNEFQKAGGTVRSTPGDTVAA